MRSQPPPSLSDVLDFSNIKTYSEVSQRFAEVAESLLMHHHLCIENITIDEGRSSREIFEFQLLEIEFYLYSPNVHEDLFCHGHINQTKSCEWYVISRNKDINNHVTDLPSSAAPQRYFHRAGKGKLGVEKSSNNATGESQTSMAGGYRGGTRKGVDLTFGNPVATVASPFFPVSSPIHGGVLLRSMRSLDKDAVISGPSLLVDRILQLTRSESIVQLVNHKLKGHLSAIDNSPDPGLMSASSANGKTVNLFLRENTSRPHHRSLDAIVECSPRVGLELSHSSVLPIATDPRISFIGKMYRYFIYPNLLKTSNRYYNLIWHLSRRHFINRLEEGENEPLATDLITQFEKETFIRTIALEKYVSAFRDGYRKHHLKDFVGSAGKGVSSNPLKYMKMMGVLCRLGLLEES